MKISFNPKLLINSSIKQNKIPFKGSFNVPLDAFVPQEPKEKNEPKEVQVVKNIQKTFKAQSNTLRPTYVKMWSMSEDDSKNKLPEIIQTAIDKTHTQPLDDIFMSGGLTKDNRYFVAFNSYYFDKETKKNSVQYYCLVSKDDKPTPLQKAVIKFFNDINIKVLLKKGSKNNPFEKLSDFDNADNKLFEIFAYGLAAISKNTDIQDLLKEDGTPSPVVYTGDGKYVKFKLMKLDLANL